ncbi:MAG: Calx-beta domain-containing protein, partial [Eudoraea sp.]|uniref:Calx-beta domain-containing protein n=1 Tax=Eudoraea sp. TaxID=1979955 RepID=UPI003C733ECD
MKFNPLLFTFILLAFFGLAVQSYGQETYLDNFSAVSYSNNNGTQNFSGNWNEINDNNNPNSGRIRITGGELRFEDISRNNRRIQRSADLTGAASATLSLDWRTSGLDGSGTVDSEQLNLQVSSDGISFTTIGIFTGSQSGSFSQDISAFISANTTIRLINVSTWGFGDWESGEFVFIDNVQISAVYSPMININDISVNENAGTATFTATHLGLPTGGPFTVNYQTVDGTATAGNDYTAIAGGTLNFNGIVGDTETIVVSITDDTFFEAAETYTIQLTGTSDVSVNITDTGTGTINDNEVVLG